MSATEAASARPADPTASPSDPTASPSDPTASPAVDPQPAPGATPPRSPLAARAAAELVGTAALVAVVVGSGIQATDLTPDVGLQLLANSIATVFGLGVLIVLLGPVSGAHFNPAVTLAEVWTARRGGGVTAREAAVYVPAQITGGITGAVLAGAMFGEPLVEWSTHERSAGNLLLGEVVATAGLILLVFGLARTDRLRFAPAAVASYIGAAYWFTSSTSFANPAVTIGRAFTDTFAGIAPSSVPGFVGAQLAGAVVGLALVALVFGPGRPAEERPAA
ncbi:aquaporin family protein [Streptomyces spongiicola]|uniref:Aquaporin family protein n=1 Tax=Streptomyces spongiicola TaxID=1690221 RepID=A0A388SRC0_9ACTN|nr:MIP/aquaporin family protein [Streptomyces spongiicola]GBP98975.1 aquaporin family protein [Streptomyces spongiicola]